MNLGKCDGELGELRIAVMIWETCQNCHNLPRCPIEPNKPSCTKPHQILHHLPDVGKPCVVGYHSKTFSKAETHYDIYDKELTAIDWALQEWQHLFLGNQVIIHSDHANLRYYWHLHKLSERARQAIACLMQYNLMVKQKPDILNCTDALSCCPDYPPVLPVEDEIGLPPSLFMHNMSALELDNNMLHAQCHSTNKLQNLSHCHKITC